MRQVIIAELPMRHSGLKFCQFVAPFHFPTHSTLAIGLNILSHSFEHPKFAGGILVSFDEGFIC
jgi:hypothetical protein